MKRIRKWFKVLGPGFITGASDDDPAGIGTYAQTGALFGFSQAWTALFSFPLMSAVQEMCGRIGLVTGKGLAGVIKQHYSKSVLYPSVALLLIANTINIGADLGAMAAALQLLIDLPLLLLLGIIVVVTLCMQIFIPYKVYASYLKYLTLSLFAYVITAFIIKIDWGNVLIATIIPNFSFSKDYIMNIVAIFGTTISPYLFFWQASEEVEEEVKDHKLKQMGIGHPVIGDNDIVKLRVDTMVGMFFSNLVMFFIIVVSGTTLHTAGITQIESASQAASSLKPLAGDFAFILFAAGIIGTGLLAVPVLAGSSAYAVSEAFGWKEGLYRKMQRAKGFYAIIASGIIVGALINLLQINPMQALYYSAVLNGIIAPPLLILILLIANSRDVMGKRVNGIGMNILGIMTIIVMSVAAVTLLITSLF